MAALWLGAIAATGSATDIQIHPILSDKAVHSNSDRWRYFFELPHGVNVSKDGSFSLEYDTSPTMTGVRANMTVLLNGVPIDSVTLQPEGKTAFHWEVPLPAANFKEGFNELTVATRSRTVDGPCLEDDDLRNWVKFRATSLISFHLADMDRFPLSAYPYPYINGLSQPATSTPIVLGPAAGDTTFSAAFNLAASWGRRLTEKPLIVQVTRSQVTGQAVHLGLRKELANPKQKLSIEVHDSGMWITGFSPARLDAAVNTLNYPEVTAQMKGFAAPALDYTPPPQSVETRLGITNFDELGYSAINLTGIGTQSTTIVLRRPLLLQLGRGVQLRLHFRHAATLVNTRSLLAVTINNQYIGSVALTPENANDGTMVCTVPINLVDSNEWSIMITAHNDIANVDCSKNYDDVAWTTILGSSEFELREGSLPSLPYLEGFPYVRNREGKLPQKLTVGLGPHPSDAELSFVAATAALAAQSNHGTPTWVASTGDTTGNEDLIIGRLNDDKRFKGIMDTFGVKPTSNGVPEVIKDLPILASTLVDSVVVQAVHKPSGGVGYVVLAASDQALNRFTAFLADPKSEGALRGQVAVFSVGGDLYTFDMLSQPERRVDEKSEMQRYKPEMKIGMTSFLVCLGLVAIYIGSKFVKRKHPKK
ncbi:MAG: cellulose biosynthesis cyclic di-GMP-binding regulatory protein BcsB [Fimbriimonas sp.]|nr:cellulose biosynthesis cyclic di-GMP-binding regulatory protein BcsB [Fimbriimonas sp.]